MAVRGAVLFRLARPAVLGSVMALSCTDDMCGCTPYMPNPIVGVWSATQFLVTPTGQTQIDALAAGGSLTITIIGYHTSGSLIVPGSVTGGAAILESMKGMVTLNHSGVSFLLEADTFVQDLTWQRVGTTTLTVDNQVAGSAAFTITLTKQ